MIGLADTSFQEESITDNSSQHIARVAAGISYIGYRVLRTVLGATSTLATVDIIDLHTNYSVVIL